MAKQSEVIALTPEPPMAAVRSYFGDANIQVGQIEEPSVALARLGTQLVPTTILVGVDGRVRFHHTGVLSPEDVEVLREMLN